MPDRDKVANLIAVANGIVALVGPFIKAVRELREATLEEPDRVGEMGSDLPELLEHFGDQTETFLTKQRQWFRDHDRMPPV